MPPVATRVGVLVFEGVQSLDVTGPVEVFAAASELIERTGRRAPRYEISLIGRDDAPLWTSSGLKIVPDRDFASAPPRIDTLIVPGGRGSRTASKHAGTIAWIERTSGRARRTASVCTGAFLLAAAGLLDGRRATTHWAAAAELARLHPGVTVDPEPIFLRDGAIWTSAGVTAGMDLALALVEEDLDRQAALTIARHLVMFLRRPGNQSQFSATLAAQEPAREPLREVRRHIVEHPSEDLSVDALAARSSMSARHFARAFRAETGITPARYVESVRLEAARRALEDSDAPVEAIARASGFGSAETMRRAFLRSLAVGPAEYRRRFAPAAEARSRGVAA